MGRKADLQKKNADIVFCIDVTQSMQHCIDGIKSNIKKFINGLQASSKIDYRLALVAYRDIHDEKIWERGIKACDEPWIVENFTDDVNTFTTWLDRPEAQAYGGGEEPESTLDALYIAIKKSSWREHDTHRVIVLFTDSDSHPTIHPKTIHPKPYREKDSRVMKIIEEFQRLKHGMLYMVVPQYQIYETLEKAGHDAIRTVIADYIPNDDSGLHSINFSELLESIGKTVSASSLNISEAP